MQEFPVSGSDVGARMDVFLGQKMGVGRTQVKKLLAGGKVTLNGRGVGEKAKGLFLREGSVVGVEVVEGEGEVVGEKSVELRVVSEGEGWVMVDKPAGVAVHPLEEGEVGTMLNAVAARYPQIQGVGEGGLKSGVVHRLDVDTSGVLLFATDQERWVALRKAFKGHTTKKVYRAIVDGEMEGAGREMMDLVVVKHSPARVGVVNPTQGYMPAGARECYLNWRVIERLNNASLIEVELGTGFLHQIRVMMAHVGHAVVGDGVYGKEEESVPRQMLHASYLRAGVAEGRCGEPEDFMRVLKRLGG